MRIRFRWKRFLIGWGIVAALVGIGYLSEQEIISLPEAAITSEARETSTPRPRLNLQATAEAETPSPSMQPARTAQAKRTATARQSVPPTSTPAPVELYTPTIEADVYEISGPSYIVFKVPVAEYNFADKHIIGLDDAATKDVQITVKEIDGEYVVDISSSDALETPDEDVGVFVGDVEADFCGDPQPVLTVNEPLDGANWKPTRWYCTPFGGGGDDDIHMFPILDE